MRAALPILLLSAGPAMAATAEYGFFSLRNTNFIVLLGFLTFLGILLYFKVPGRLMDMLDARAEGIRADLAEARSLRDEAQALLASYDRKTREAREQADAIVAAAKAEAKAAAAQAKVDLEASVARRLTAAEDQIDSARAAAIRDVRDEAIRVAVAAAGDVVARQMSDAQADALIDRSIDTVGAKLH